MTTEEVKNNLVIMSNDIKRNVGKNPKAEIYLMMLENAIYCINKLIEINAEMKETISMNFKEELKTKIDIKQMSREITTKEAIIQSQKEQITILNNKIENLIKQIKI